MRRKPIKQVPALHIVFILRFVSDSHVTLFGIQAFALFKQFGRKVGEVEREVACLGSEECVLGLSNQAKSHTHLADDVADSHIADLPLFQGLHPLLNPQEGSCEPPHISHKHNLPRIFPSTLNLVGSLKRESHRLLNEDMFASAKALNGMKDVILAPCVSLHIRRPGTWAYFELMIITSSTSGHAFSMSPLTLSLRPAGNSHVRKGLGDVEFFGTVLQRFLRNLDQSDRFEHVRAEQKSRELVISCVSSARARPRTK